MSPVHLLRTGRGPRYSSREFERQNELLSANEIEKEKRKVGRREKHQEFVIRKWKPKGRDFCTVRKEFDRRLYNTYASQERQRENKKKKKRKRKEGF